MNDLVAPVVRRAILDFLNDVGGELNDADLHLNLKALGHRRIGREEVREALGFLTGMKLVATETLAHFTVARILERGREVADGDATIDGVSRFKTGD